MPSDGPPGGTWPPESGPITGRTDVDRGLRTLVGDLEHLTADPHSLDLPADRQTAVRLVWQAAVAHQRSAGSVSVYRDHLRTRPGQELVREWETVTSALKGALAWIPDTHRAPLMDSALPLAPVLGHALPELVTLARLPPDHRFVMQGEWLHLVYHVGRFPWALALSAVGAYAELLDRHAALHAEHQRRWDLGLSVGIAVMVYVLDISQDEAWEVLDATLGRTVPALPGDRALKPEDLRQERRARLLELTAGLRSSVSPSDLLAGLYEHDQGLMYLPHAAQNDLRNWLETLRARPPHDRDQAVALLAPPTPGPDRSRRIRRIMSDTLCRNIRRIVKLTPTEERILQNLVSEDGPEGHGRLSWVAQQVGCSTKTVNRCLAKLRRPEVKVQLRNAHERDEIAGLN